jgi:hypothetical protein
MYSSQSTCVEVDWSGIKLNSIPFHPNTCGLILIHMHPNKAESPSLVLVINDTKLLMPCVKCFELGISNTCDEGVCGKEW